MLGLSVQIGDHCKATVFPSIVADKVHPSTVTRCTSSPMTHRVCPHLKMDPGTWHRLRLMRASIGKTPLNKDLQLKSVYL